MLLDVCYYKSITDNYFNKYVISFGNNKVVVVLYFIRVGVHSNSYKLSCG